MAAAHRSNALIAQLTGLCSNLLGREGFILREHRCPSVGGRVSFVVLRGEAKAGLKTAFCVGRPFVLSSLSFSLLTFKATVIDSSVFEDTEYEGSAVSRWLVACELTESLCTQNPLSSVVNHHALTIGFLTIGFLTIGLFTIGFFIIDFSTIAF